MADGAFQRSNSGPTGSPATGSGERPGGKSVTKHVTFHLVEHKEADTMELPITGPLNLFVFLEPAGRQEGIVDHEAALAVENSKQSNSTVMAAVQGAVNGEKPEG